METVASGRGAGSSEDQCEFREQNAAVAGREINSTSKPRVGSSNMPAVYFYCGNEPGNLQEDVIALAEGFSELGVPFYANCNYWLQSTEPGDYLIRHDPDVCAGDCGIVIVSYTWPQWVKMRTFDLVRKPLPAGLFGQGRRYVTIYMDNHDGYRTVSWKTEYRQFDLILRSKLNSRAWHPENMRPWAYGWTNRVIRATAGAVPFGRRRNALLVNFGVSHPYRYNTRTLYQKRLEPLIGAVMEIDRTTDDLSIEPDDLYEHLMWTQTGGRFSWRYYERLKSSKMVAAFCGDIVPPAPYRPERCLEGGGRAKVRRSLFRMLGRMDSRPPRAVGADSFRFWEALAAGCATLNVDLGHYGVELPVMPENWKHYLGVDFSNLKQFVERMIEEPEAVEKIAEAGRNWAAMHYSPKAAANRLLELAGCRTKS